MVAEPMPNQILLFEVASCVALGLVAWRAIAAPGTLWRAQRSVVSIGMATALLLEVWNERVMQAACYPVSIARLPGTAIPLAVLCVAGLYTAATFALATTAARQVRSIGTDFSVSGDDLFPYNREIIYMNWQTYHGQNIMGGVNGYYPRHRVELQPHIDGIPRLIPLANLALAGLTHLAYHKNMRLRGEPDLLPRLARSRFLTRLFDDDAIAVFGLDLGQMRDTAELLYGTRDLEKVAGAGGGDGPRRYDSRRPDFVPPALRR